MDGVLQISMFFSASILASLFALILSEHWSQNDAKIDAKMIQSWFWVASGAADVDLEHFLVVFGILSISDDFYGLQKSAKNRKNRAKPPPVPENALEASAKAPAPGLQINGDLYNNPWKT